MKRLLLTIALMIQATLALPAHSAESPVVRLNQGQHAKIDRYGVCRDIWNNGTRPVGIPNNLNREWSTGGSSFLQNLSGMSGVRVAACGEPMRASRFTCSYGVWGAGERRVCNPKRTSIGDYAPSKSSSPPRYRLCDGDDRCKSYGSIMASCERADDGGIRIPNGYKSCRMGGSSSSRCESGHDATTCAKKMNYSIYETDV